MFLKTRAGTSHSLMTLAALFSLACSASESDGGEGRVRGANTTPPAEPSGNGGGSSLVNNPSAGMDNGNGLVNQNPEQTPVVTIDDACVIDSAQAEFVKQPVDIILLLDNSGSMSDELQAVEDNINVNFANQLNASGIDYRVILISRHRRDVRGASGEASTSICVTTPLSGLADCTAAPEPVFSERFFQYSTKIESDDSFDVLLDTYFPPFLNSGREEKFDQAPLGWSAWLRPGAKKVLLEMTDDQALMTVPDFLQQLSALSPTDFGTPQSPAFVFHSIIGIGAKNPVTAAYLPDEPVNAAECTYPPDNDGDDGNDPDVANAGVPYQELSKLTGGLRFPICEFTGFDVVFKTIAEDVVFTSNVACDFAVPPPPTGLTLNLEQVAVDYNKGDGSGKDTFGQAASLSDCRENAFYIQNDRINLCPQACDVVRRDPLSKVDVLFTCKSTRLPPR